MQTVRINCDVLVDDLTAKWVEELIRSGSLASELAYTFTQRSNGGYVVKGQELDAIIDDALQATDMDTSKETIEEAVKKAMLDLVASGSLNLSSTESSLTTTEKKEKPSTVEEETVPNVVMFAEEPSGDENQEEMTEEDADDLASFFGF